jgi:hypothetical protein
MTMKLKRISSPKAILMTVTIIRFYSILYFDVFILPFLNLGKEYADNIRKYLNRYYEEVVQNGKIY